MPEIKSRENMVDLLFDLSKTLRVWQQDEMFCNGVNFNQFNILNEINRSGEINHQDLKNKIGVEKRLTILFADIEGYTPFTESVQAFDLVYVLNRYYYLMGKIIKKHHGKIIDYYGDGLLAVFGFDKQETMEIDSVSAGIEMMNEMKSFNIYLNDIF